MRSCSGILFVGCITFGFLAGCGKGAESEKETVPVTGIVTVNGDPVEGATVNFHSEKVRVATGTTDGEGKFTLTTFKADDGAVLGKHKVTITHDAASSMPNDPEAMKKAAKAKSPVNKKYASVETSGLNAEVTKDGENDFKFDLK